MKVRCAEEVAIHSGPESCGDVGNCVDEALTGGGIGRVLSREMRTSGVPTWWVIWEGNIMRCDSASTDTDPARSETLCMYPSTLDGSWEIRRSIVPDGRAVRAVNPTGARQR